MADTIHVMPEALANLIAAGEVVERPASALKELVENAIDAQATHVFVEIKGGGLGSLTVKDDGVGMSRDDARLCLLRHASSKIKTSYDLMDIRTMGFRGEALPSIVAVSRFALDTSDGSEGTRITAHGEETPVFADAALRKGTTVTVADLFYNTPARLKYMKSEQSERAKCLDVMEHLALGFPQVSFDVRTDGRPVFNTTGRGDVIEVVQRIWGNVIAREMMHAVDSDDVGFALEAFVAKPETNYATKFQIMTFLNSRYIYSYRLSKAVEDAYKDYLAPLRYPFAVIKITADPSLVDVNVHPSKKEVRISGEEALAARLKQLILTVLKQEKPIYSDKGNADYLAKDAGKDSLFVAVTPVALPTARPPVAAPAPGPVYAGGIVDGVPQSSFQGNDPVEMGRLMAGQSAGAVGLGDAVPAEDVPADTVLPPQPNPYADLLPLGQVARTYIVCESPEGLCIMDQHAAAERINFERLQALFDQTLTIVQPLEPVVLELAPSVVAAFDETKRTALRELGFAVSAFGTGSLKLDGLPSFLTDKNYLGVIRDLIVGVATNQREHPRDLMRKAVATMACKASVKAGQILSPQEEVALIRELGRCENPANCPHGRPTVIKLSLHDLEHLFKRTGF